MAPATKPWVGSPVVTTGSGNGALFIHQSKYSLLAQNRSPQQPFAVLTTLGGSATAAAAAALAGAVTGSGAAAAWPSTSVAGMSGAAISEGGASGKAEAVTEGSSTVLEGEGLVWAAASPIQVIRVPTANRLPV